MKKIKFYLLFILIWCLPICSYSSNSSQEINANKELGERFIQAWHKHDINFLISLFTTDGTYEEVCSGRKFYGKNDIGDYVNRTLIGMPDSQFEIINISADELHVSVEWIWKGTNSVGWPYMGLNPTNQTMKLRGVSFIDVEDGKIKNVRDYWDWNSFIKGIGVSE